jgi:hypothetical protein
VPAAGNKGRKLSSRQRRLGGASRCDDIDSSRLGDPTRSAGRAYGDRFLTESVVRYGFDLHLGVWGIRRNFFKYVDVSEQETAIGVKKKSRFFSQGT